MRMKALQRERTIYCARRYKNRLLFTKPLELIGDFRSPRKVSTAVSTEYSCLQVVVSTQSLATTIIGDDNAKSLQRR